MSGHRACQGPGWQEQSHDAHLESDSQGALASHPPPPAGRTSCVKEATGSLRQHPVHRRTATPPDKPRIARASRDAVPKVSSSSSSSSCGQAPGEKKKNNNTRSCTSHHARSAAGLSVGPSSTTASSAQWHFQPHARQEQQGPAAPCNKAPDLCKRLGCGRAIILVSHRPALRKTMRSWQASQKIFGHLGDLSSFLSDFQMPTSPDRMM